MATFEQAGKRLKQISVLIGKNSTKMMQEVALAVDQAVVTSTPVRDGTARLNWQVTVGTAAESVLAKPETPDQGLARAIEQGRATILAYAGKGDIHITNNVPYIGRLNNGYSAQAPIGFVEDAVSAGHQAVRQTRLLR